LHVHHKIYSFLILVALDHLNGWILNKDMEKAVPLKTKTDSLADLANVALVVNVLPYVAAPLQAGSSRLPERHYEQQSGRLLRREWSRKRTEERKRLQDRSWHAMSPSANGKYFLAFING
jgi:hypothetical protein